MNRAGPVMTGDHLICKMLSESSLARNMNSNPIDMTPTVATLARRRAATIGDACVRQLWPLFIEL